MLCAHGVGLGTYMGWERVKQSSRNVLASQRRELRLLLSVGTVVCVYVHLHSGHSLSCMGRDGGGDVCRSYSLLAVSIHDTHRGLDQRSVSGGHIATRQPLSA